MAMTTAVQTDEDLMGAMAALLDASGQDRIAAVRAILAATLLPADVSPARKAALTTGVRNVLKSGDIWRESWQIGVFMASVVLRFGEAGTGIALLAEAFARTNDRNLRAQLLYSLRNACFSRNLDSGFVLWDMFFHQYEDWFGANFAPGAPFAVRPDRAVILASQILVPPHQPTVDAVAKSAILNRWGFETVVVNTNEFPAHSDLLMAGDVSNQRNRNLYGLQNIDGMKIFTPVEEMPSDAGYREIFDFVAAWQPAFVLNFGAFNLSAEYLGRFVKVVTMPAGTELVATRTSAYDVCFHPLTDEDRTLTARYGMQNVGLIDAVYNYGLPEAKLRYDRGDFDLSKDDFVVSMVGRRLGDEIDAENADLIEAILNVDARIVVVFGGEMPAAAADFLRRRLPAARLRFPGFIKDIPAFYRDIVDLSVNPRRMGGGASAAFALAHGVPAFTLDYGHVSHITHPDFVFSARAALLAAIAEAVRGEGAGERARKARERYAAIGSRERMLQTILKGADVPIPLLPTGTPATIS